MPPTAVTDADHERARLAALRRYGVLDGGPDPALDELVRQTARACGYPTALLTLMEEHRCCFAAAAGLEPTDARISALPREQTFCNRAFRSSGIFVVPDALADENFRRLPYVDRPNGYRAYAGVPLVTADGFSIGALCILDRVPREPTPAQRTILRELADRAMAMIEARRQDPAPPTKPMMPAAPAARRTVLVVDDEALVRGFVQQLLHRHGLTTLEAVDGLDALTRYRENAAVIGLVMTDLRMPVMDGLTLIRALKCEPNPPAIGVMSGQLDAKVRVTLHQEGVRCVLAKPFSIGEIAALVALVPV